MDRVHVISEWLVKYGVLVGLAGLGMVASVIFMGAGAFLLAIGIALVILGILGRVGVLASRVLLASLHSKESSSDRSVVTGVAAS